MNRKRAAKMHAQIAALLEDADDAKRSRAVDMHTSWRVDMECVMDQVYRHNGELYRCRQTHTTQEGWEPDVTGALFKRLMYRDGIRIIPDVITTGDMFANGELGWWGDTAYRSLKDANVYTPEQRPADWEAVE